MYVAEDQVRMGLISWAKRFREKGKNNVLEAPFFPFMFKPYCFTPSVTVLFQALSLGLILPLTGVFKQRTFVT